MQSLWHGYSKKVACERRHEVTKVDHNLEEIDIYEMTWYKIVGLSTSTYMLYKVDSKCRCKILSHGNKSLDKFKTPTK
jgi:hypothetical protein